MNRRCGQICFVTPIFLKKFCWQYDSLIILPQSQLPINSLQCTTMYSKFTKNALFCVILCSPQNNKKNGRSKSNLATVVRQSFFKSDTKQAKFLSWGNLPIWPYDHMIVWPYHHMTIWPTALHHLLWSIMGLFLYILSSKRTNNVCKKDCPQFVELNPFEILPNTQLAFFVIFVSF